MGKPTFFKLLWHSSRIWSMTKRGFKSSKSKFRSDEVLIAASIYNHQFKSRRVRVSHPFPIKTNPFTGIYSLVQPHKCHFPHFTPPNLPHDSFLQGMTISTKFTLTLLSGERLSQKIKFLQETQVICPRIWR